MKTWVGSNVLFELKTIPLLYDSLHFGLERYTFALKTRSPLYYPLHIGLESLHFVVHFELKTRFILWDPLHVGLESLYLLNRKPDLYHVNILFLLKRSSFLPYGGIFSSALVFSYIQYQFELCIFLLSTLDFWDQPHSHHWESFPVFWFVNKLCHVWIDYVFFSMYSFQVWVRESIYCYVPFIIMLYVCNISNVRIGYGELNRYNSIFIFQV